MKTSILQTMIAVTLIAGVTNLGAVPDVKGTYRSSKEIRHLQAIQPGGKYALVCDVCHSATTVAIKNHADLQALCHNGGLVHCESCKKRAFVKLTEPSGKFGISGARISYVNAQGHECMHLVRVR